MVAWVKTDYGTVPFAAAAGVLVVNENQPPCATSPAMMPLFAAWNTPVKSGALVSSGLATIQYCVPKLTAVEGMVTPTSPQQEPKSGIADDCPLASRVPTV